MAENETTVAQQFSDTTNDPTVATQRDTIKGWNDRRKSNNQIISSMVPFVQLIGLFDEKEYQKMFAMAEDRVTLHWDDASGGGVAPYNEKYSIDPNIYANIREQINERVINVYIVKDTNQGLNVDPIDGILMAEKISQVKEIHEGGDPSGGIGITDLQVDYGKSNVLGAKKYNLRMTINNPAVLDKRFEYSKLATFGGQFLIIYGWSNPSVVPGYDAVSPPTIEIEPNSASTPPAKRLVVPLRNLGNGGYWSAARVGITNYDFGFNEMGKLEINVTLMDDATNGMTSTLLSSVGKRIKEFLNGDLFAKIVTDKSGNQYTIRDELQKRQEALNRSFRESQGTDDEMSQAEYDETFEANIAEFAGNDQISVSLNPDDVAAAEQPAWSDGTETPESVQAAHREATESQEGYPLQPALYTYKQVFKTVVDQNPKWGEEHDNKKDEEADEENKPSAAIPTKQVISYEKTPAYYFLGAILDSVSLTIADPKYGIGGTKVPAFYYPPVNQSSKLATSFQTNLQSVQRKSSYEERIQDAVIRLKERFLPPGPVTHVSPSEEDDDDNAFRASWEGPEFTEQIFSAFGAKALSLIAEKNANAAVVSGTQPIYFGKQTSERTDYIEKLYPTPPSMKNMVYAPMRGHIIRISRDDANSQRYSNWPFSEDTWRIYLPDWKEEIIYNSEGVETARYGSPHGFDPLNPTEYRAAPPIKGAADSASPFSEGFETRSNPQYERERNLEFPALADDDYDPNAPLHSGGRGGRFFMVMAIKGEAAVRLGEENSYVNVINHNVWRFANKQLWNLLQKKWHNLYVEYMGDYFERLIRERVGELEALGIPIESIYNEPLDLDYLTGKIYLSDYYAYAASRPAKATNFRTNLKTPEQVAGEYAGEELNITNITIKTNQEISKYRDIIEESTLILNGPETAETRAEDQARRQSITYKISVKVGTINAIKESVEELTGGRYNRTSTDVAGNTVLLRFRNFTRLDTSQTETVANSTHPLIAELYDQENNVYLAKEYKPDIIYEYTQREPMIKEEWMLWDKFNIPTDNFQKIWHETERRFLDEPNKAQKWKASNPYAYDMLKSSDIPQAELTLRGKLKEIEDLQFLLNQDYESYIEHQNAISNAQEKINQLEVRQEQMSNFFNQDDELQLTLYDDTSDYDTPIEVDMSRDKPAVLTTKVAQQFFLRMSKMTRRGTDDVRNYVIPRGGKPYYLPSNVYEFRFDPSRREWDSIGTPRRVIDPGAIPDSVDSLNSYNQFFALANMFKDLSMGVTNGVDRLDILSKNQALQTAQIEGAREDVKIYSNWTAFGSQGMPGEEGNNEWGFKAGPPDDEHAYAGGNYVRSYKDFLNLMMVGYNPDWSLQLKIIGPWPMPYTTRAPFKGTPQPFNEEDRDMLRTHGPRGLPMYTLMDSIGNIIVPDHGGGYKPSGWYLEFGGDPVYLYPSFETATKINTKDREVNGVAPGHVMKTGLTNTDIGAGAVTMKAGRVGDSNKLYDQKVNRQRSWEDAGRSSANLSGINAFLSPGDGRSGTWLQQQWDQQVYAFNAWKDSMAALFSGDFKGYAEGQKKMYLAGANPMVAGSEGIAIFRALFSKEINKLNDGVPIDYQGIKGERAYGARIDRGGHCPNLTLDMKRSLIYSRDSTTEEGRKLQGQPGAFSGGPTNIDTNWPMTFRIPGEAFRRKKPDLNAEPGANFENAQKWPPATYSGGIVDGKGIGNITDPWYNNEKNWSNPEYPYGTGFYGGIYGPNNSFDRYGDSAMRSAHGPWQFPTKKKNWVDWGDFLYALGPENGYGFFNNVDNNNYSPCLVQPNGAVTDGLELNDGFVKFIIENVWAPLPHNRRCGARNDHKPIVIKGDDENDEVYAMNAEFRVNDVTYGDLFGPLRDDSEDTGDTASSVLDPATFGNIENFRVNNIGNVPIRTDVVNNLLSKNNTNMSVAKFIGEIFQPGAIGVNNIPNPQLAIRQREDGTYETMSLSDVNWDQMAKNYSHLFTGNLGADETLKRFPEDIIVFDFKAKDSLIENIDMNSKFDPLVAKAFRDAAVEFTGNTDALINFLSYKDVAKDLKNYLETSYPALAENEEGNKAIEINPDTQRVTINKNMFLPEGGAPQGEIVTAITKFLQASPARLNNMRALMNANNAGQSTIEGGATSNYATNLMANYMRKTTITIHGTTNLAPFQKVIIKGIMPNLEGMYIITNTRESITPQGFQTILEGTMVRPPSGDARINTEGESTIPPEAQGSDVVRQLGQDGEEASEE